MSKLSNIYSKGRRGEKYNEKYRLKETSLFLSKNKGGSSLMGKYTSIINFGQQNII